MRAGSLRRVGTLQRPSTSRGPSGGRVVDFVDVDKSPIVRFAIQQTQGREIDSAGDVRAIATWTITMRYRPDAVAGMRIKAVEPRATGGFRYYKITSVNDVNQLHHELELTAVEGLSPRP